MTGQGLPKYRVSLQNGEDFEIQGFLEYQRFGAVAFLRKDGQIIKLIAHGSWTEITRITDAN